MFSVWFLNGFSTPGTKPRISRSKDFGFDEDFSEESMGSSNDVCLSPVDGPVDW